MKKALFIGAAQCLAVAGYHFALPYLWGWDRELDRISPAISWGVYAINFLFSYLLFAGGVMTLLLLYKKKHLEFSARLLFGSLAIFWALSAIYQLVFPFPMPASIIVLKWVMLGIAFVSCFLFITPFLSTTKNAPVS